MLTALTLAVLLGLAAADLKGLGVKNFRCDPKVMAPSASVPKNVNQVRFADIKVIGALGDSLTAANGAGANPNDPFAVILQYRGLCFHAGGDMNLTQHITIPNILRQFNPKLVGYSKGVGSENVWEVAKLNGGIPGAESGGLAGQAQALVEKLHAHPEIDIKNDWKLINIFIGANDICGFCNDPNAHSAAIFRANIEQAIRILKNNVPRTIVSLTGMFDMGMLRRVDANQFFCDTLHVFECHCESDKGFTDQKIAEACSGFMKSEQQIQDSGEFEANDFTFVIQPFFEGVTKPPLTPDGKVDLTFFAPDCFHFSRYGHAIVAKNLWNTMVQPVGHKMTVANLSDPTPSLHCPSSSCPYFPTVKNSKSCHVTPSILDVKV